MVKNEQGWQHWVVLFSLPIFAILSIQKTGASNEMLVEDKGVCFQLPYTSLQLPATIGNSAGGGPLRVLGFIARAAKSCRRRDDSREGLTRSAEQIMIRQMITSPI